jgi:hypothetical protein
VFAGAYRDLRTGPQIVLADRLLNPIQIRGEVVDYIHHRPVVAGGATHWANFNKKVHKPPYWTLEVARVKKARLGQKCILLLSTYFVNLNTLDSERLQGAIRIYIKPI